MTSVAKLVKANKGISTHTLTWSVTRLSIPHNTGDETISTHTLTWSVTAYSFYRSAAWKISTHTLTWSVTVFR